MIDFIFFATYLFLVNKSIQIQVNNVYKQKNHLIVSVVNTFKKQGSADVINMCFSKLQNKNINTTF